MLKKDSGNVEMIKREIAEIDNMLAELIDNFKITGELNHNGTLVFGDNETLPEAVERKKKQDVLRNRRSELERHLS